MKYLLIALCMNLCMVQNILLEAMQSKIPVSEILESKKPFLERIQKNINAGNQIMIDCDQTLWLKICPETNDRICELENILLNENLLYDETMQEFILPKFDDNLRFSQQKKEFLQQTSAAKLEEFISKLIEAYEDICKEDKSLLSGPLKRDLKDFFSYLKRQVLTMKLTESYINVSFEYQKLHTTMLQYCMRNNYINTLALLN
ncbi:MAG: hypothetical protein K2X90_03705 [Candidatus Babeliaceae bacterium]|nr:hypothetical protein [Candidatus Babeliaceae bacterium]